MDRSKDRPEDMRSDFTKSNEMLGNIRDIKVESSNDGDYNGRTAPMRLKRITTRTPGQYSANLKNLLTCCSPNIKISFFLF